MKFFNFAIVPFVSFLVLQCHNSRYLLVEIDERDEKYVLRDKWTSDNVGQPANGLSCWICPYTRTGKDECLMDGTDLGRSMECSGDNNACESLIIDSDTAPIRYNRRCGISPGSDGCKHVQVRFQGQDYPGRICFCTSGSDCNINV